MNADTVLNQRIGRLTPLADVLAAIARIEAVAPREIALADAAGSVVAVDIVSGKSWPAVALALRDGWAVDSETTRDAGPYAPLILEAMPQRVDALTALPPGTDAVAPLDAIAATGGLVEITAPVAPGEGVLPAGGDADAATPLRTAGARLRAIDLAVLAAMDIATVSVRQPRVCVVNTRLGDVTLEDARRMLAHVLASTGVMLEASDDLDEALRQGDVDAIIGIGGTGEGQNDRAVAALSRAGDVICHGIGLAPGETAAFGFVQDRPVLLMPGRIDAVLACWLVLGRALIDRLSGAEEERSVTRATLARKVTSIIGMAEVVPLRRQGELVEPLASGFLPMQSLARADGWMLVPAASEGFPAGTEVEIRPLP